MYILNEKIKQSVDTHFETCKVYADYVTDNPESGPDNSLAAACAIKLLKQAGYEVTTPYFGGESSFCAVLADKKDFQGPKIALLCEYDALPVMGHACGHSISGAITLLAGLALRDNAEDIPFRVDIIGTPEEELAGKKVDIMNAGGFDSYEFCAMVHLSDKTSPGGCALTCSDKYITFKGKSAHASAAPHEGLNALNAARLFMDAIDMWRQHLPEGTQIHGVVEKGGYLPSIVPDNVELNYYFRTKKKTELAPLYEKIEKAMLGAALATGTRASWQERYQAFSDLWVNPKSLPPICGILEAMGLDYHITDSPFGSTDCGDIDQRIPTFHPMLAATGGKNIPLHSPEFAQCMKTKSGYEALRNGAVLLASIVERFSKDEALWKEIKAAHKEYRGY